ncbi:2-oxoacid:acceptor oxidoreductase subunit alpha [Brevibacillus nitrificans]|uniref:2-oxoacid:acceptor oxidoreductase subunit alpha n=1 Tax=Brevibacillus nitrificans TaxID=651560 RepID=A0A3M8DKN1_9BACL|nr:2-oxoacid:acceptor oxidoreductase subunit alpha [Brevibacillus nitrificans]RNB88189.1 2-oxoacid:acceptor oxidoreductase subunit alpha [Brevibacillus nitrificans]
MISQLSWKVGGQQGEGIESTGEIFSMAMNRMGYHLYSYRHFSSRIKGGHTNNKIRVSTTPMRAISDDLDILVAFDQETIDFNAHELREGGIIIADAKFNPKLPDGLKEVRFLTVPLTEIADELGTSLMKNMVSIGASSAILGIPVESYRVIVEDMFLRKGEKVVEKNMDAIRRGFEYVSELTGGQLPEFQLDKADPQKQLFLIGNDAIALGAVAAGCRFMPAYPITPASEVMEYLIKKLPKLGGTVIQTEDEIAAITMAIGANFAGARSLTASAGPGLSLMMEAIGLAGITETPVVIVDTQRGGPSTGMPTKIEQSDVNAMIYGTHGDIPKVVIAPSTVEECFYDTVEAFNLAEEYQLPVIVVTDLTLSLGKQTVVPFDYNQVEIRRGKLLAGQELPEKEQNDLFKRYEVTEDGVSPRVIPGQKYGLHHVTGVEHDQTGRPSENAANRKAQMEKRMRKLDGVLKNFKNAVTADAPHADADVLVVGINSTIGTIQEAKVRLEQEGVKVNHAQIRLLHPFPTEEMAALVAKAKKVVVVEHNIQGQVTNLLKQHVGNAEKIESVLKYDGNPFLPKEIYAEVKELVKHGDYERVSK